MPPQKFCANLAVLGALYNVSESVAKRLSAANIDLENPWQVREWLRANAHSGTRVAAAKSQVMLALETHTGERSKAIIEKSGFYLDAIATQYGVNRQRIEAVAAAGIDLRDRKTVRSALASQGTQPSAAPTPASDDRDLERAKAKIEEMARRAPEAPASPIPAKSRVTLLDILPKAHYSGPAIEILTSMTTDEAKAALSAGVTMNDPESLKKFLDGQKRYTSGGRPLNLVE